MGTAASLFYSANDAEKQTLYRRITPSDDQFEEQQLRWNALADHLLADLEARSQCATRSWLQGSYKFGTQIRPTRMGHEFDIDLGLYMEWEGNPSDGPHDPGAIRNMVQQSLISYANKTAGIRNVVQPPKVRCSRIHYDGDFHIDVPSYHLDPSRDARTLAAGGGWEISDPKALYVWWKNELEDAKRIKARRHIKYLKCWAALKFPEETRPSSVLLTVLAAEAMSQLDDAHLASDDDALLNILEAIAERLGADMAVLNPVNADEDLNRLDGDDREQFVQAVGAFRDNAAAACACDNEFEAAVIWTKSFEHFFPMPEVETISEMTKSSALPVPIVIPDVRVVARPRSNSFHTYEGVNRIGPIPKDCEITFEVANAWTLPSDMTVEWMVRNEGGEAEQVNDLGHPAGIGFSRTENSAYRGTHYMDCVFRRSGRMIGARRIPVQIAGTAMPPRNPPRRPDWVRLRGTR
jgi:Adenylyl/Guanylyl and SMODS C-terminal sensor domain